MLVLSEFDHRLMTIPTAVMPETSAVPVSIPHIEAGPRMSVPWLSTAR